MKSDNISVIIMTFNEQIHIRRCITSLIGFVDDIYVLDCYSTDSTCEIAESLGAKIYKNNWVNYSTQFNWALDNLPIKTEWILRLDADEILDSNMQMKMSFFLNSLQFDVDGVQVRLKRFFLGRWIKFGGMYPIYLLRIFRNGKARCEQRWMDEHICVDSGKIVNMEGDIIDNNLNNIGWWTEKHNSYATREAISLLGNMHNFSSDCEILGKIFGTQAEKKRWLKQKYTNFPLFVRPFLYFIYRYFIMLGFLDGKEGLIWHFLQGFWYRFLVDAKIFEIYLKGGKDTASIKRIIKQEYGIEL